MLAAGASRLDDRLATVCDRIWHHGFLLGKSLLRTSQQSGQEKTDIPNPSTLVIAILMLLLVPLKRLNIGLTIRQIDYGTNYIGGTGESQSDAAWLVPLALQLAPALILLVGMLFMPFTPRWLVHHGRPDEAKQTLAKLRSMAVDHELVELEFLEIRAQSIFEKRTVEANFPHLAEQNWLNTIKLQFVSIASLFKTMPMFRRVIVATVTMFFQQWTGINAILYYAPTVSLFTGLL